MRPDADVTHRVARRIQTFELDRLADLDYIAGAQSAAHLRDLVLRVGMRQHRGASRSNHLLVAAGVVAMLMGVEDLPDGPALRPGGGEAFLMIQRIDCQRLAGFLAGDQVVKVATGVRGPDLFDDHRSLLSCSVRESVEPWPAVCHLGRRSAVGAGSPEHVPGAAIVALPTQNEE